MHFTLRKQRFVAKCLNFSAITFTIAAFCLQGHADCFGTHGEFSLASLWFYDVIVIIA
jgi:hypothetical protein